MTQREIIHDTLIQLVELERAFAQLKHGKLHSNHEAWAVLKEEIGEVGHCFNAINKRLDFLWGDICRNDRRLIPDLLNGIQEEGINLAEEALQICAVARRWEEMLDEKEGNNGKP